MFIGWNEVPRLVIFSVSALIVGFLGASQRSAGAALRRTQDDLHAKMLELEKINAALKAENAERKLVDEALRRSESYLDEAQNISRTGSFGWKPGSGEIYWSKGTYRMFQCDPNLRPTIELVLERTILRTGLRQL